MSPSPFRIPLAFILLLVTAAAAAADGPAVDVSAPIDKLTDVADSDIGYSPSAWGHSFLPLDRKGAWGGGLLFQKPEVPSETLRAIVKQGAAAVPHLIAHLDDKRPTKITITHDFGPLGGLFHSDRCDYNIFTAKEAPNPKRSDDEGGGSLLDHEDPAGGHVLTVGDLCFVTIGQIVNRRFDAVRYQPTAIIIVTSPTASPALPRGGEEGVGRADAGRAPRVAHQRLPDARHRRAPNWGLQTAGLLLPRRAGTAGPEVPRPARL